MTPKRNFNNMDSMEDGCAPSFPMPQTIPGGWDVSAFFGPEQQYPYRADMYGSDSVRSASNPFDSSEDTL